MFCYEIFHSAMLREYNVRQDVIITLFSTAINLNLGVRLYSGGFYVMSYNVFNRASENNHTKNIYTVGIYTRQHRLQTLILRKNLLCGNRSF